MGSWVTLTALQVPFAVALDGVSEADARHFVQSWQWCEAREAAEPPAGAELCRGVEPATADSRGAEAAGEAPTIIRASVQSAQRWSAESVEGEHRATAPTYRALADQLSGLITRLAIDARRGELLMFHAGGVADPATGDVIAFIGPSGRGKTTASIALGRVFEYVTDETLAVQDDLGVLPYGKPLSVKQPPPEVYKDQVSPSELELNRPSGALRLVGVVMLDRQAEHSGAPSIRAVRVAESIEELVPQISYLPERSRPLRRLVEVLEACGGLRAVTYGEAATLPDTFAQLFADARAAGDGVGALRGRVDVRGGESGAAAADGRGGESGAAAVDGRAAAENTDTAGGELLRAEYADAVRDGESMIVLSGTTVRVLGGIAPTIVESVESAPQSPRQLVDAVVAVHGDPGEGSADELVAAAVQELVELGLLARVGRDE